MSSICEYRSIGLISGSSLDGVDLAIVQFQIDADAKNPIHSWKVEVGKTYTFPGDLANQLRELPKASALDLVEMNDRLGLFMADRIMELIGDDNDFDFIGSHGHTIFHHPGQSSTQIGSPSIIAATTGIDTVGHLRNMDTAYGGQGAPLAPMADLYLFPEYDVCVNLGGIANISIKSEEGIIGYDVCGANQMLNHLAQKKGQAYDNEGIIARQGQVDIPLLQNLNNIEYCLKAFPKSLDNEEVRGLYLPLLDRSSASIENQMATMVEHICNQLKQCATAETKKIMVAGGGAHNRYLVERLSQIIDKEVVVPKKIIIDFKEAILMAMCGALYLHQLPNSLMSITGAGKDTVNGMLCKA